MSVPGLYAGGGGAAAGYQAQRSLRFRASASASASRAFIAGTDPKKFTVHFVLKRGKLGAVQQLYPCHWTDANNYFQVYLDANDKLNITGDAGGANLFGLTTTAVFRVPEAHMSIDIVLDSANATAANRCILSVNNVVQTLTGTSVPLNATFRMNDARTVQMGQNNSSNYLDGYLSEVYFVDGKALTPSAFGEFDSVVPTYWKPKSPAQVRAAVAVGGGTRNGFGTNGFYLPFSDPTSLTTLMYDRSQSDTDTTGNNWTANNISLTAGATYDSMLDVPLGAGGQERGNYCTLNPLVKSNTQPVFKDGNLYGDTTPSTWQGMIGTIGVTEGEWYWEMTGGADNTTFIGIIGENGLPFPNTPQAGTGQILYFSAAGDKRIDGGADTTYGAAFTNQVIGVALSFVTNTVTFYRAGVSQGALSLSLSTLNGNKVFPFASKYNTGVTVNFGQRPFTYTPPTGFKALHTGNLPTPPVPNAANAFVSRVATKANIVADIAAARAGWTGAYVDIFKNQAAAENWGWRFSHLAGNEYSTGSSSTYQANRAMSGTDAHFGCSIRIGTAYGTAAGTVAHTGGVASTITHNIGVSARQLIMLFHRTGSLVKVFHPELAAGKLLELTTSSGEATDGTITSVTANSFQVGSGVATGTYDYLVVSETSGLVDFGKHTGNGSTDGPCGDTGGSPSWIWWKRIDTTQDWMALSAAVNPSNVAGDFLRFNVNNAQGTSSNTSSQTDLNAGGYKVRNNAGSSGYNNASGGTYAYVAFLGAAFKNANAR